MESENNDEKPTTPTSTNTNTMMLTKTRQTLTPYLPPPLIKTMHAIDTHPFFTPYTTEPSMTIFFSVLACFVVWNVMKILGLVFGGAGGKRSTLHLDDDDNVLGGRKKEKEGGKKEKEVVYNDTVVLCGPVGSGKTSLLYKLCGSSNGSKMIPTVMSMKATIGYIQSSTNSTVRIIDYPGHPSLSSQLPTALTSSPSSSSSRSNKNNPIRIVYTLDATKPIADGAELFYSILTNPTVRSSWISSSGSNNNKVPIYIVCTKQDVPKSKNWKRMKIQLRTELDKIRRVLAKSGIIGSGVKEGEEERLTLGVAGKNLDFENLGEDVPVEVYFTEVSCVSGDGMDKVKNFVLDGTVE